MIGRSEMQLAVPSSEPVIDYDHVWTIRECVGDDFADAECFIQRWMMIAVVSAVSTILFNAVIPHVTADLCRRTAPFLYLCWPVHRTTVTLGPSR